MNLWKQLKSLKAILVLSLLGLLAVACSVPIEVEESQGLDLVAQTSNPGPLLDELKSGRWEVGSLKIWEAEGGGTTVIATLLNAGESDLAGLKAISGVTELSSREHTEKVERSLLGAMMNNFFEVHLNTTGMSDAEINTAINQQLASQGFSGNVQITRGEDGQQLDVVVDDADLENLAGESGQIFIALDEDETVDGDGQLKQRVHMKMGSDPMEIDGTMSDEEIRAGILEKLRADGIDPENASITISRTPGGDGGTDKVEVGVQVEEND